MMRNLVQTSELSDFPDYEIVVYESDYQGTLDHLKNYRCYVKKRSAGLDDAEWCVATARYWHKVFLPGITSPSMTDNDSARRLSILIDFTIRFAEMLDNPVFL